MTRAGRRGRLVAVCGIDGSGKATQAEELAQRARAGGIGVEVVSFPRYGQGFFAGLVERYLRGEFAARAADLDPYLAALPYACDRWQAGPALRDWLKAGRLVVCNRYVPANMAHQGSKIEATAGREAFYNWISELEYGIFGLPVPDLAVLLEMPGGCALELIARRERGGSGREGGDIHEADASHLAATALAYREVAARSDCPWAVVSCASQGAVRPVSDIAQDVWAEVSRVL